MGTLIIQTTEPIINCIENFQYGIESDRLCIKIQDYVEDSIDGNRYIGIVIHSTIEDKDASLWLEISLKDAKLMAKHILNLLEDN